MPTYDLSRRIEHGMPIYPGDPDVVVEPHATHRADGYRVTALSFGSHAGTHVDAPAHTEADGATLGEFPIESFAFEAIRADLRGIGPREPITRSALRAAVADGDDEERDSAPVDADLLVCHTGWDDHWGTPRAFDHPYLTPAAASWCAERGYHVGTDAMSVDPSPSPSDTSPTDEAGTTVEGANDRDGAPDDGLAAHHALLGAGRLVIENLVGLDRLPDRFELRAYPLPLDADGAPVRAVATV